MKEIYIKDLKFGQKLQNTNFAIKSIRKGTTQSGKEYMDLILTDKTGEIAGKVWENNLQNCAVINDGDIISLNASVEEFRDKPQLNVTLIQKLDEYDLADFLPTSTKDLEALWLQVKQAIAEVKNPYILELLNHFFSNKDIIKKYKISPAAEKIHHAYLGGLLEHVCEMLDFAKPICQTYPEINKDLLITGILLHDIGKIDELNVDHTIFRTLSGNLLGHITQSALMVEEEINKIKNFPEDLKYKILHLILSHHGELEFGSPVRPMIIEAIALNMVDNTSAKLNTTKNVLLENKDNDSDFSDRNFALNTKIYLK